MNHASPLGVRVVSVTPGGAFANASIEPGDVIVRINNILTPNVNTANNVIANAPVGTPVPVRLRDVRTGTFLTIQVVF